MRIAIMVLVLLLCGTSGEPAFADSSSGWQAYLDGRYAAALRDLKPLAEAGNADAEYALGTMYSQGRGVLRDARMAAHWYEQAARQGHVEASFSLGFLLFYGVGSDGQATPPDPAAGLPWIEAAATHGNAAAQYFLGAAYWVGNGVETNRETALRWTLLAAEQGITDAQYQAGMILATERGVDNAVAAYQWLELAARAGHPSAARQREQLAAARLTAAEVRRAQALADAWHRP